MLRTFGLSIALRSRSSSKRVRTGRNMKFGGL